MHSLFLLSVNLFYKAPYYDTMSYNVSENLKVSLLKRAIKKRAFKISSRDMSIDRHDLNLFIRDDFPDMGGNKTGEVDALCILDECSCVYNLVSVALLPA